MAQSKCTRFEAQIAVLKDVAEDTCNVIKIDDNGNSAEKTIKQ